MHTESTTYASEQEILELINSYFNLDEDSLVAIEELGNQDWCITVEPADELDLDDLEEVKNGNTQFKTSAMLNQLCSTGVLSPGKYVIDCTW